MGKKDITQKSFFENAEWFADLMNAAFFGGEEILVAEELLPEDGAVQKADAEAVAERLRDVVKKQTKDGSTFALYVLENQTTVDYAMLIRIMVEESLTYDKQVKAIRRRNKEKYGNVLKEDEFICGFRRKDRLAPVFTLVLYWGDKEWDAKTNLQDLVTIPAVNHNVENKMKELIPNYRIKVFDLNNTKDFSSFKTALRTVFEFYSCRKSTEALRRYLLHNEAEVKALDEESKFLLITMIKEKRILRKLEKKENKEDADMCEAIQGMIDEGKAEGKAESVIFLLSRKGKLSKEVKARIIEEKDNVVLERWLLLASNAESTSAFEAAM